MLFSIPFYRDASQLPGPFPDYNMIERETRTFPRRSDYDGRLVVIRDKYVVKYSLLVTENEGHTFVEERLSIAAPRLYAIYRDRSNLYIVWNTSLVFI